MSHVAAGKACLNPDAMVEGGLDTVALRNALVAMGDQLELVLNKRTYNWAGRWFNDYHAEDAAYKVGIKPENYGKCSHAIRFKNAANGDAEVGLVLDEKGQLRPVFDYYAQRGEELSGLLGGPASPRLVHQVAVHKILAASATMRKHHVKSVETLAGGVTRIRIGVRASEQF